MWLIRFFRSFCNAKIQGDPELAAPWSRFAAPPPGSRNSLLSEQNPNVSRIEIAEREEFTHTHHTLENRIEERSGPVTRSLKPAFKAALGVGVVALGVATSGIVGTLFLPFFLVTKEQLSSLDFTCIQSECRLILKKVLTF